MQAIMETIFDICYLSTAILAGIAMIRGARGKKETLMFGIMAVILGSGDAFHLIPRAYALWSEGGLAAHAPALGIGKLITSVTMTIFYILLYYIWRERYKITDQKGTTIAIYALAAVRIALCMFPQNMWLSADAPVSWGIYRNLPFAAMGIIIIVLFYKEAKKHNDKAFGYMWLAITLSFLFYVPVVLWADAFPLVGTLMIPKTLAYVWIIFMGYSEYRQSIGKSAK